MPNLSQIELPSGTTYDLVDQGARDLIDAINNWSYIVCTNASNTPKDVMWDDEGTTITGTLVATSDTMYKIYLVPSAEDTNNYYSEYITINPSGSTYTWEKFGDTKLPDMNGYVKNAAGHSGGTAGALAYKDSASGSGTVTVPKTFTTTYTPAAKTVSVTGTTTGSVSAPTFTGTGVRLQTDSQVLTGASFTGSSMTSTGSFTPSGSISKGTGTANYTPEGSVTVSSAGSTTTIKNPTAKTVVTDMSVSNPSSTTASGELVYCSVSGTKLSLKKLVETTGDSITTSNTTVKIGDPSYSFSGTGAELKFTGTSGSVSVTGTSAGSITPTKSNVTVSPASSGTATYTPAGTNSTPTFTGASMTSTGSYTPAAGTAETTVATTETKTVSVTVS